MSITVTSILKEVLTVGHGLAAGAGAFAHKLYVDAKAAAVKAEATAKAIAADVKKDL